MTLDALDAEPATEALRLLPPPAMDPTSPFQLVAGHRPVRRGRKDQLLAITRHIERQAVEQPSPPLLLAAFEHAEMFDRATAERYASYATICPLVAAFGVGLAPEPAAGVRGATSASTTRWHPSGWWPC